MNIPKTLVIGIYLHGVLPLNENGEIQKEKVPDGLCVTTINSVAPGISNISTIEDMENIATKLSIRIKTRKNYDKLTNLQIKNLSENLRNLLVNINKDQSYDIIKVYHRQYSKTQVKSSFQKFTYQYDNSFRIKTYDSFDSIPNKLFNKFSDGELINPKNFPEHYFNKIILYNLDEFNLFEMLESVGLDVEEISMEHLMVFLVRLGVKNLIIIDLSCSVFNGDAKFLSDRHIRQIRRQILFK
jgi:hypothetical protein